ncbi:MAG: LexA family transcriptional regulator [Synechococcaceae cyanobacterium SM2_3_1]|nr:LexA family transcriptional regulator [Synechococcaceae cyanobacterium SM2_3_1]
MILHPGETYLVRVVGDSMINANLLAGDVLIVDRVLEPRDRSIVVAIVDGELTVKRLRIVERRKFLMPENDDYPMIPISERVYHWGVVIYSYRKHFF